MIGEVLDPSIVAEWKVGFEEASLRPTMSKDDPVLFTAKVMGKWVYFSACLSKMGEDEQQIGPYCTDGHPRKVTHSKRGWYSIRRKPLDEYWLGIRLVLHRVLIAYA